MKHRFSKVLSLALCGIMILSLTGCGDSGEPLSSYSKDDLIEYAHSLETDLEALGEQNADLAQKLVGIQGEDVKVAAITEFSDGTGRLTLHSDNGVIELPDSFAYPNSYEGYTSANIRITDNIYVSPSSNWSISLNGEELDFYHTVEGINGKFVIGTIDGQQGYVKAEELKDVIAKFFESMPPVTISYSRIYCDATWCGEDAKADTFVDEAEAQLRMGMLRYGDTSIVYSFEYSGASNSSKDEMILSLLKSLKVSGTYLKFEQ